VKAKSIEMEFDLGDRSRKRSEWQENKVMLLAAFIATLVLGYTPDVNGIVSWFLARGPRAGAFLSRGHQA
jgi:hypothetical protein